VTLSRYLNFGCPASLWRGYAAGRKFLATVRSGGVSGNAFLFLTAGCREVENCRSLAKNQHFPPQGTLGAPIHVKYGTDDEVGELGRAQFRANQFTGEGTRPKKLKISLFGKESLSKGNLWPIYKILGAFIRTPLRKCFKFDAIPFSRYGVIDEKPCVVHLTRYFLCTL